MSNKKCYPDEILSFSWNCITISSKPSSWNRIQKVVKLSIKYTNDIHHGYGSQRQIVQIPTIIIFESAQRNVQTWNCETRISAKLPRAMNILSKNYSPLPGLHVPMNFFSKLLPWIFPKLNTSISWISVSSVK